MAIDKINKNTTYSDFLYHANEKNEGWKNDVSQSPKNTEELVDFIEENARQYEWTRSSDREIDGGDVDAAIANLKNMDQTNERDSTIAFLNDFKQFLNTHKNLDADGSNYLSAKEIVFNNGNLGVKDPIHNVPNPMAEFFV